MQAKHSYKKQHFINNTPQMNLSLLINLLIYLKKVKFFRTPVSLLHLTYWTSNRFSPMIQLMNELSSVTGTGGACQRGVSQGN
jgi:hypothetical protein